MKRLVISILILMMLSGCAAKAAIEEGRPLTVAEQKEAASEVFWFAAELALTMAIDSAVWGCGYRNTSGQKVPDWWRD